LGFPQDLSQALQQAVTGLVFVAGGLAQALKNGADAGGVVDAQLFFKGKMQGQV
jgi:hypothetical protein